MLRRVGLIGDIHCEVDRLKQVIELFRGAELSAVLSVGDISDGRGNLTETCQLLAAEGVLAVAGNHDRWLLTGQMRDIPDATPEHELTAIAHGYLSALPKTRLMECTRGTLMLCHGLGEDDMASVRPDDDGEALHYNASLGKLLQTRSLRFVVNGHSHRPMLRTIDSLTILNAGTLHPQHRPVCSVVDFEAGSMQVYDVAPGGVRPAEHWSFERGSRPRSYAHSPYPPYSAPSATSSGALRSKG